MTNPQAVRKVAAARQPQPIAKLTTTMAQMIRDRHALDQEIKKLTASRDAIDAQVKEAMGDSLIGMHRLVPLVEMKPWTRVTIDPKALRAAEPAIAQRFEKVSSGRTLHYM